MAQYDAFDSEDSNYTNKPDKDISELGDIYDEKNWGELSKWLVGTKNYLAQESRERFKRIENNLALYKGIQYQSQTIKEDTRNQGIDRSTAMVKIAANHIYDLVQNKVSRLIKYRPAVVALPTSNELEDRVGAKMSESLVKHVWYMQDFEGEIQNEFVKLVHIMGECYLAVVWDPNSGDIVEEFKQYQEQLNEKGEVMLTKDDGTPELDDQGKPIKLTQTVKYGDTVYEIWYTLDCLVERVPQWKNANYMFNRQIKSKAILKKKYPNLKQFSENDGDVSYYDFDKMQVKKLKDKAAQWKFYHKKTEELPKGAVITFVGEQVVACEPMKDSQGDLPVVRLTDIDLPGETHGESFITMIKSLTGSYNNLTNMILRNQVLCSHPKWVFPVGSVRKESLGNDITMVEFKGPQAPQLMQQNPTPAEVFNFRGQLKEEFQQISGVFGVSRGQPPPGIKAGVALQFLAEQESERENEMVLKYSEWYRQVAVKTLERCGDNYEPDDKRMIMVIGQQNKWMSTFFDVKYLARKYDVRVQNASALPQSKAARTQYLLDLNEQFPNQVPPEMVLDMLDISQPDKFIDYNTASVRAAEAENESIMQSVGELNDPQEYEDHIIMWKIHTKQMREWSFKNQTPVEIQESMKGHVMAHEMLMIERAKQNPAYLEQCMALPGWPIFFDASAAMPPPPPAEALPPEEAAPPAEGPLPVEEQLDVNVPPESLMVQADQANVEPQATGPIDPGTAI
jgi:hypothetical protein